MKRKHGIVMFLLLICFAMSALTVSAADDRLGTVVDGSLLTDEDSAESIARPLARGAFLSNGTGGISIVSGRTVKAKGTTTCYSYVDKVSVKLYLQRLVGSTWQSVQSIPTASKYNAYYVSNSQDCSVTGGYYYRVIGTHSATEGSTTESFSSYTNGIWVD